MPLDQIDKNHDNKICEQELQKALKDGFFEKSNHLQSVGEYLIRKGGNDKLMNTMKSEIIKLYLPAIERKKTHDEIVIQGKSVGFYGVNIGLQKQDNDIIRTVEMYERQFDSGFFRFEKEQYTKSIQESKEVQHAKHVRPSLQAKEKAEEAKDIIKKFDSTNVILQQYMTSEYVRFDPLSWEDFAINFPDDKQVVAFKQWDKEQKAHTQKVVNSRNGISYQTFNKPKPSTQVPQTALKLYLPGGGTHITKVTNDIYPLLHNQDGCEIKLVVLSVSGRLLNKENFAFVDMKDNGDLIIKNTDYKPIRTITAQESWDATVADEKIFDVFNSPETKKAQDNMTKMQHKLEPLQVMRKKFEESSLFFGKNNITPEEVEETRKMAVSVKPLIDELERTVPQRKQDKANLQTMLSELPKDSPLVGTKKAIQDMIDAYDVLIEQCEKRPGKESPIRGFINALLNPAQFSEVNLENFGKKNSPMIIGAVVGAFVTVGSGGALGPMAIGVLAGMGLGRVAQEGVNRMNIFDKTINVDGKKVTLDFHNPTDVELRATGKLSNIEFTSGLLKEFTMQFVMQVGFAKGLAGSQKYINTHLAKYPNGNLAKLFKIIKPQLPKIFENAGKSANKVASKVKPPQQLSKIVVVGKEVIEEHTEELTEEFINTLSTNGGGNAVNFLIKLYGGINPKNRLAHKRAFYDSYKIQDVGLYKSGDHTVMQKLQTDARDRIQDIKNMYKNNGYAIIEHSNNRLLVEKKHVVTDESGAPILDANGKQIVATEIIEVVEKSEAIENNTASVEVVLKQNPERVLEVRFMGYEYNSELFKTMYEGSKKIAEDIKQGNISFENAWDQLTQMRGNISKKSGAIESKEFYESRLDTILDSDPSQERSLKDYTPMNGVYELYKNKANEYIKFKAGENAFYHEVTEKIPTTNQEMKLTVISLFQGGEFVNTRNVETINTVKQYMSSLYNDIANNNYPKDILIKKVAELHWWSAHIMLNRRGSALVTDAMIKGLLLSKGYHATMWKKTLSPDLEAMIMDKDDYISKYENMMENGAVKMIPNKKVDADGLTYEQQLNTPPADMTLDDFISMQESKLQGAYLAKHFNNGVELSLDQFGEQYTTFVETLINKYPADQQTGLREEYGLISIDIFAQVESMNSMVQETYISSKIQFESQLKSLDKTHKEYKEDKKKLEDKLEDLEKGKTAFGTLLDGTLTMDNFSGIRTFGKSIGLKNIETHMLPITKLTIINTLRKQKPGIEITQSDIDTYILDQLNNKEILNDTFGADVMKIPELGSNGPAITLINRINSLPNTGSELLTNSDKITLNQYINEHIVALQQGLGLNDIEVFELMSHNVKNLLFQNIADKKLLSGSDHGILHIVQGDIFNAWAMLDQISGLNPKQRMQIKAMLGQMITDHDIGYNMKIFEGMLGKPTDLNPNRNKDIFFQGAKDHPLFGRMYVDAMAPFYNKFFTDTDFEVMKVAMLNHSDVTGINFTNEVSILNNPAFSSKVTQDAMQSMLQKLISLADCMGVTYVDKLHSLFQAPNMMHLLGQYDYINQNFPSNTDQGIVLLKQVKQQMFDELSRMQKSGKIDKPTEDAYHNALEKGMDVSNKKSKNPNGFPLNFNMSSYIYKNSGITIIDNTSGVMNVTLDKQMYDAVANLYTHDVALNNLNKLVLDYGAIETINSQPISGDKNSQDIAIKNAINTLNDTSLDIIVRCRDGSKVKVEVIIDNASGDNIAMKENLKKVYSKDVIIKDAFIDLDKALTSDDNLQILKQIATISQQYPDLGTTIQSIIDTTSFTNQEKGDAIKQIRSEKIIQTYRAGSTLDIQINSINDNLKTIEDDMNTSKNQPKKFYESIGKLTDAIKLLHGKINTIMDSNVSKVEKLKQLQIVFRSIGYVHHTMHISHTIAHESKHLKDNLINKQYIAAVGSFATLITAAIIGYGVVLPHLMHFYDITAMFPPNHSLTMVSDFIDILSNKVNMTFTDAQRKYNELKKISDFKQLEITVENQGTFVGNLRNSISVLAGAKTLKLYPQVFNIWKNFDYHLEISENTQVIDLFNHILSKIDIVTNKSDHLKNIYTLLHTLDLSKTIHRDLVHNIHSAVYDSSGFDHDGQEAEVEIGANHWMHTMHMFH